MRIAKPYWKKSHECYYVNLNGKNRRLDPDEEKAKALYKKLLDEDGEDTGASLASADATVHDLLTEFLDWTEKHREPLTYHTYKRYLSGKGGFADHVGGKLRVRDMKPFHVTRWIDKRYAKAGNTTKAGAITAVKRAFSWAADEGYIKDSPIARVKLPTRNNRGEEAYFLPDQWKRILAEVMPGPFLDLITVMKETGCRPQEIKIVGKRHFNAEAKIWVFPKEESKGRKEQRVVPLNATAFAICQRLALKHPDGPMFRNTKGKAWNTYSMNCACARLEEKVGFPVFPYAIRHTFATQAIIEGIDLVTIATIMGHKDLTMLSKIYQHVKKNLPHLMKSLNKATNADAAATASLDGAAA